MNKSNTDFVYMVKDEVFEEMANYLQEEWNMDVAWGQLKKAYKESQIEVNKASLVN